MRVLRHFLLAHLKPEKGSLPGPEHGEAERMPCEALIWSTLEDTRKSIPLSDDRMPTFDGKYKVPTSTPKVKRTGSSPSSVSNDILGESFYWTISSISAWSQERSDGKLCDHAASRDKKAGGIAAEDIGKTAYAIFERAQR